MKRFAHAAGTVYQVMDGVRRAKAAYQAGHTEIQAEVVEPNGQSLGEGAIPVDALRSPKARIRRITPADEARWNRAVAGASQAVFAVSAHYGPTVRRTGNKDRGR